MKRPSLHVPDRVPGAERVEQSQQRLLHDVGRRRVVDAETAHEPEEDLTATLFEGDHHVLVVICARRRTL